MSAERRLRREAQRVRDRQRNDEVRARLAEAEHHPAELIAARGGREYWRRGPILFGVPALPEGLTPELTEAIVRRRIAVIQGVCPCGARIQVRTGHVFIEHHIGCDAEDAAINALTKTELARRGVA